jgi:hypothetical protein
MAASLDRAGGEAIDAQLEQSLPGADTLLRDQCCTILALLDYFIHEHTMPGELCTGKYRVPCLTMPEKHGYGCKGAKPAG